MSRLRAVVGAAVASWATRRVLNGVDDARWVRENHRGAAVSLLGGPAVAAGAVAGSLLGGGPGAASGAVAAAGGAVFGLVDDLAEDASARRKGLAGHLGALARGELTTGGLKVLGIGATSLLAAAMATGARGAGRMGSGGLASRSAGGAAGGVAGRAFDVLTAGALIAGTANLVNLLDLRPGRALKAAGLGATLTLCGPGGVPAAACLGAAAAELPADLGERDMIGDGGANAIGALLGTALVHSTSRGTRLALLAGVVGLTLASERVSFSRVIAKHPVLRRIDDWGRQPVVDQDPVAAAAVEPGPAAAEGPAAEGRTPGGNTAEPDTGTDA